MKPTIEDWPIKLDGLINQKCKNILIYSFREKNLPIRQGILLCNYNKASTVPALDC